MKNIKKKCDQLWSQKIREKGECEAKEISPCVGGFNAAHIIRRGNNAVRFDLENGLCLCIKHHYWFDKGQKFETTKWFNKKYPGRYNKLKSKNKIVFYKQKDYEKIYDDLMKY